MISRHNPRNLETCFVGLSGRGLLPPNANRETFRDGIVYWGVWPDQVERAIHDPEESRRLAEVVFRPKQPMLVTT